MFTRASLVIALSFCSVTVANAQAADDHALSKLERSVDASIKPGDDFFAYANGDWLKATELPSGAKRFGVRDQINEITRQQVATLLEDAKTASPGSTARKVADFRAAFLNETAIESKGLAPIKATLDKIDRVQDKASLTRLLGSMMPADVDPLNWGIYKSSHVLGLSVEPSIHAERTYVAFLVQGGLGLPDRENYLSADSSMQSLRTRYQAYIARMLELAGFVGADQRAAAVMALETAIAKSQATQEKSANDRNADSLWTRADFVRNAPGMDWAAFFTAARLTQQSAFVPWQPTAVRGLAALVSSQPIDAWKDYLRFHEVDRYADVLPKAFAEQAVTVRSGAGAQAATPAQRALDATQSNLSDAIGRMYAERYFPSVQKARVKAIIANVAAAFARRVEAATWMTPQTKAIALAKVNRVYVGVGYPEKWQDYSDLTVKPDDAVGNLERVASKNYRMAVERLGKPVDFSEWGMPPQRVGAILIFQTNSYEYAAALLQSSKFDSTASDAAVYGSIGAIMGHDFTHFVDLLGAQYDVNFAMRDWWTAADSSQFQAAANRLDDQFATYRPFPDAGVNGKLTQSENIADLGGLAAAFDAYRKSLGSRAADKNYVRAQDREFFLAFAQGWRVKFSEDGLRAQLANDHAPENYRVSTVRNLNAWYDAFDVVPGQRLYLEPQARVRIW